MPRMRGRLYSSCASSTCSFPSALTACWAKMSRISCVRSTTRDVSASSSARCCGGLELVVDEQHLRPGLGVGRLQLLELALADVRARVGMHAVLHELAHRLDARGARELAHLGELVVGVRPLREHGDDEPALGLELASGRRVVARSCGGVCR